jgi:hypothetical protein
VSGVRDEDEQDRNRPGKRGEHRVLQRPGVNRRGWIRVAAESPSRGGAEAMFRRVLADPSVPLRDRARMASAVGAIMGWLAMSGELFTDVPSTELADLVPEAVRDLLGGRGKRTRRTP